MGAGSGRRQLLPMNRLWAYAYEIMPPLLPTRLGTIRALLREAAATARTANRRWSGRLVLESDATHILIVTDVMGRHYPINLRLEAELLRLQATFSVTEPLAVDDPLDDVPWLPSHAGNGR
jgi:hypothetical protein